MFDKFKNVDSIVGLSVYKWCLVPIYIQFDNVLAGFLITMDFYQWNKRLDNKTIGLTNLKMLIQFLDWVYTNGV